MMPSTPKLSSRRSAGSSSIVQTSTRRPRVVSLACESTSDDGYDAFVFLGRLYGLEGRVVKGAEVQHMKDPITNQLDG